MTHPMTSGRAAPAETDEASRDLPRDREMERAEELLLYAASGYDLPTHPAHIIRRVHQRATLCFQQVMAGESLSPTQFAALATVLKHDEVSQNYLGRLTAMDPSTISLVVHKLLKEGLISRGPSEADQRLVIIRLTEKGKRYTLDRLARSVEVGRRLLAPLSIGEQTTLLALLQRIASSDDAAGDKAA